MKLILASSSPRRKEILEEAGYAFEVMEPMVDETLRMKLPPIDLVMKLALLKASAVFARLQSAGAEKETVVVGADTIVCIDGKNVGKPKDAEEARAMLCQLSGRLHRVYTGVALLSTERQETFFEQSKVKFVPLSEETITRYVATGEPFGKAGGYAAQGRARVFIESISGDFYSVVGLPVAELSRRLSRDYGIPLFPAAAAAAPRQAE